MEPSGSLEPVASRVTCSGSLPLDGVATSLAVGSWLVRWTVIVVAEVPDKALAAVNVTTKVPVSLAAGVHVKVPVVLPGPGVKLDPEGPAAASEAIGSPFGSEAVTLTVSRLFSATVAVAGDVTAGAPLVTILIAVVAEAVKLFEAVNVT